jgi:hypothetical protein
MQVTLVVNDEAQATAVAGVDGRYTLEGRLQEGQNWVFVMGTGALASREWPVTYAPRAPYSDVAGHWAEQAVTAPSEAGEPSPMTCPGRPTVIWSNYREDSPGVNRGAALAPVSPGCPRQNAAWLP